MIMRWIVFGGTRLTHRLFQSRIRRESKIDCGRQPCAGQYFSWLSAHAINFPGKVVSVRNGAVMSEVVIDIGGGHQIVSLISASSVKRLKLKKGSAAVAVIKATEVIISTDLPDGEG